MRTPFAIGVICLQLSVAAASAIAVQLIWRPVDFPQVRPEYELLVACGILSIVFWAIGWPSVQARLPMDHKGWLGAFAWVITLILALLAGVNGACAVASLAAISQNPYAAAPLVFAIPQIVLFGGIAWVFGRVLARGNRDSRDE